MAVKASVDTSNQTTVRVGQQNATQVTSTQTGITYAATAGTAFNVVGGISSVTQLSVSGISTLGIVTAVKYYGDGSNLTGTGNTTNVSTNSLVVLGISTLGITSATDLEAQQLIVTGISTLGISTFTGNVSFGSNALFGDNDKILLGNGGSEFQVYHDGSTSIIKSGEGNLNLQTASGEVILGNTAGEVGVSYKYQDRVEIRHDNTPRLQTTGLGITVFGTTQTQTLNVSGVSTFNQDVNFPGAAYNILWDQATSKFKFDDSAQCVFGSASGGDMKLFHQSGNSTIRNETGQFRIAGNDIRLQTQNHSEDYLLAVDGGSVSIFYNDIKRLETSGIGITVTGVTSTTDLYVTGVATVSGTGGLNVTNNLDVNGDVDLGASASNTITVSGKIDSDLVPSGTTRDLGSTTDEWRNIFISDNINANGNIVGDTATNISGINSVTATKFYGDGSGLDNTGATLSAASGTQRLVLTSLTSGTMVSAATDGDLTFQSSSNLLSAGKLLVAGISTFTGDITANGNIVGDNATNITGIAGVTASTLTGTLQTAAQPNITSLGTLTSLDVTGNVSIGGTLTYDDVTNVDSIGLITARQGIHVLAGAGVSIAAGGLNVSSGISTFVNNVNFKDTLFTDKIKRYSNSGTTTKIILNDENINLFAGDHTNETLNVTPFQVTIANNGHLNVTGVSTFAGITTVTGDTLFAKQLSVSGFSTYIGVATYKDDVFIDGTLTAGAIDGGTY